jgi:hypothetical protein
MNLTFDEGKLFYDGSRRPDARKSAGFWGLSDFSGPSRVEASDRLTSRIDASHR